jgi:hypothetical protein
VFSRFFAEHVKDGRTLHRNVFKLLKPGGVAFHLMPTLYASPFLINRILPERLTSALLSVFTPSRSISPKFPAYYSECYGESKRTYQMFEDIGYSKVVVRDFFGHFYYDKIPVLRNLEKAVAAIAARKDWSWLSSYAYITAYK